MDAAGQGTPAPASRRPSRTGLPALTGRSAPGVERARAGPQPSCGIVQQRRLLPGARRPTRVRRVTGRAGRWRQEPRHDFTIRWAHGRPRPGGKQQLNPLFCGRRPGPRLLIGARAPISCGLVHTTLTGPPPEPRGAKRTTRAESTHRLATPAAPWLSRGRPREQAPTDRLRRPCCWARPRPRPITRFAPETKPTTCSAGSGSAERPLRRPVPRRQSPRAAKARGPSQCRVRACQCWQRISGGLSQRRRCPPQRPPETSMLQASPTAAGYRRLKSSQTPPTPAAPQPARAPRSTPLAGTVYVRSAGLPAPWPRPQSNRAEPDQTRRPTPELPPALGYE